MQKSYLYFLFAVLFLCSCEKESSFETLQRGQVVEAEEVAENSSQNIAAHVSDFDVSAFSNHDVTYHVVTYTSDYNGELKNTRGLLIVPKNVDTVDLIGYFHGTHIPLNVNNVDGNTPSLYRGGGEEFLEARGVGSPWASAGFAVFMPDYFGYDLTEDLEHPFVYYPELFKANIDGLRAAKKILSDLGYSYDNDLFLTGWSQGAGAALSAHQYIQKYHSDEFNVIATSGFAGPYNFFGFVLKVFSQKDESFDRLGLYSWAVYAVNKFSNLERPTDQIWSYPVYDQMSAANVPNTVPSKVINTYFLKAMVEETDTAMINRLEANSFHNSWTPQGKVFLHHGDADDVVPYFNSQDAYDGLSAEGGDVTLYTYPGGDHGSVLGDYVITTINDFKSLQ